MATVARGPVTITYDDSTLRVNPRGGGGRRGVRSPIPTTAGALATPALASIDNARLAAALAEGFDLVDAVSIAPVSGPSGAAGRRGPGGPRTTQTAAVQVQVGANENAVILVEQDGYYSWVGGEVTRTPGRRRGPAGATVTFAIELHPTRAAARRHGDRGLLKDAIFRPVTALIFRFVADLAVGQAVKRQERSINPGIVRITGTNLTDWSTVAPGGIALPAERRARLLLMVHGTFSSTVGGFGALGATPSGTAFLTDALGRYDAVIGFDHRTLSEDPMENAEQVLAALRALDAGPGLEVDIVTHSRGALVARSLVEYLSPTTYGIDVGRVIMVAGPNSGTLLASSAKWDDLVDLYTNLVVAACRVVTLAAPHAALGTTILKDAMTGISRLVKALISSAVRDDGRAPGLAAMTPPGTFITEINQTQPTQPALSDYRSISSDFEMDGLHGPGEFPDRLKRLIADGVMDRLMGESNDLVVNVASMTAVDPHLADQIREVFEFGANDRVYHTNYFLQPEVHRALTTWLGLGSPPAVSSPDAESRGRTTRAVPFGAAAFNLPDVVDRDFVVVDASLPIDIARGLVGRRPNLDYAVVRRYHPPHQTVYHYPFRLTEFSERFGALPIGQTIESSGVLQESAASVEIDPASVVGPSLASGGYPWSRRQVVVLGGAPVGVVRSIGDPAPVGAAPPPIETPTTALPPVESPALPPMDEPARTPGRRGVHGGGELTVHPDPIRTGRRPPATKPAQQPARKPPGAPAKNPAKTPTGAPAKRAAGAPGQVHPTPPKKGPPLTFFHAEMDDTVIAGRQSMVMVEVTLDEPIRATRPGAASGQATVDVHVDLVLHLIPRTNFEIVGPNHVVVPPPEPGFPRMVGFQVKAIEAGPGEVVVVAMQGAIVLTKLIMTPTVYVEDALPKSAATPRVSASVTVAPPPSIGPCDQLWIEENRVVAVDTSGGREQQIVLQTAYDVRYQSEQLDVQERATTKAIRGDRLTYVRQLFDRIEQDWGTSAGDAKTFTKLLRAYGGQLFDELVPEPIQRILWDNRSRIQTIQVNSEDPLIPWELVHLKSPTGKIREERFLANMGLVRWLDGAAIAPRKVTVRKNGVRVLAPDYPAGSMWELTQTAAERDFLTTQFGATPVESSVAGVLELIETPGKFDLLHFAGHGVAEPDDIANAEIIVDVRNNAGDWQPITVSSTMVEQFGALRKANGNRPIVFLNACQVGRAGYQLTGIGGFAQAFLRSGAGVFVSTLWSVGDEPARAFSENFYAALSAGKTIAEATVAARARSRAAGDPSWLAYVVYGRPEGTVDLHRPVPARPSARREPAAAGR